jgi:hypothetical protein
MGSQQYISPRYGALTQHADVEWIMVSPICTLHEGSHPTITIGLGDKSIEGRGQRGGILGTIYDHVPGLFVKLIFDQVKGCDFHKGIDDRRRVWADIQPVPGMGSRKGIAI